MCIWLFQDAIWFLESQDTKRQVHARLKHHQLALVLWLCWCVATHFELKSLPSCAQCRCSRLSLPSCPTRLCLALCVLLLPLQVALRRS